MNEMELLARLRADMLAGPVPARAMNVLQDAIGDERDSRPALVADREPPSCPRRGHQPATGGGWGRTWRPLTAGAVTLAVAAGVAIAQFLVSAGSTPSPAQIGAAAAATALAQPAVRPGQWVLWTNMPFGCADQGVQRTWTTADLGSQAFLSQHRWHFTPSSGEGVGISHGSMSATLVGTATCRSQPAVLPTPGRGGGTVTISGRSDADLEAAASGQPTLSYAGLRLLPGDPGALERYLGGLRVPPSAGLGRGGAQAFFLIYTALSTYVLPPRLTAELYQALGDIPGLTVDARAADVTGRPGLGLVVPMRPGSRLTQEIVLAPRSYRLLGYQVLRHGRVLSGNAILRRVFVHRP